MSCPVDPIAWGEKNQVRLYPEKVNEWVLAHRIDGFPSRSEIETNLLVALNAWFGGSGFGIFTGEAGGSVDAVRIVDVSRTRPVPRATDQRRESLDPPPTLAPGAGVVYLTIRFNYRGVRDSMPWPVWKRPGFFDYPATEDVLVRLRCPEETDWMLSQATTPKAGEPLAPVPPEESIWSKLGQYTPTVREPIEAVETLLEVLTVGVAVYAGVQLYGLVRPLLASRRRTAEKGR